MWRYSPSGKGGFCEPVELPLLRLLPSLLTDKLDLNFLCTLCDTGVDGCLLGCSVIGAVAAAIVPGPEPLTVLVPTLAPQVHVRGASGPPKPGLIPLPLLIVGAPMLPWWKPFGSLARSPSTTSEEFRLDSDCGSAVGEKIRERISFSLLFNKKLCVHITFYLRIERGWIYIPNLLG